MVRDKSHIIAEKRATERKESFLLIDTTVRYLSRVRAERLRSEAVQEMKYVRWIIRIVSMTL